MYIQSASTTTFQSVYPDVYYQVLPFVMMACDEMDAGDMGIPTYDTIRQISDRIHDDVLGAHPDLAARNDSYQEMSCEAAAAYDIPESLAEAQQWRGGGFFRDLVDIILLNEIFRRRRRW